MISVKESDQILKIALNELIDEDIKAYEYEMDESYTPSDMLENRMRRLITGVNVRSGIRRIYRTTAAVIAIVVIAFASLLVVSEDMRAYTLEFIRTHLSGGFISYVIPDTEKSSEAIGKIVDIQWGYVPEGFELEHRSVNEEINEGTIVYRKNDTRIFLDWISDPEMDSNGLDNEHSILESYTMKDGTVCDLYRCNTKGYSSFLVWKRENVLFTAFIKDNLEGWEVDELIKVAESLRIISKPL